MFVLSMEDPDNIYLMCAEDAWKLDDLATDMQKYYKGESYVSLVLSVGLIITVNTSTIEVAHYQMPNSRSCTVIFFVVKKFQSV